MPESINSLHILVTLIATGFLFGLGFSLAQLVVSWPASHVAFGAFVLGALVCVVAWLI